MGKSNRETKEKAMEGAGVYGKEAGGDADLKGSFSRFLIGSGAVKFGSFRLKSGRISPYFINLGSMGDGASVSRLGEFYARALIAQGLDRRTDVLFGPAYKGIPIAVSTAVALSNLHGRSLRFAFNRKEAKDHGEGGIIVGDLREGDRVGILDDVMTTGKTKEEVLSIIRASGKVEVAYILIAVDRLERGETELAATLEFKVRYGVDAFSIVTIEDIAETALGDGAISAQEMEAIHSYLEAYGGRG